MAASNLPWWAFARRHRINRAARRRFAFIDAQIGDLFELLTEETNPGIRTHQLFRMASHYQNQADAYAIGWGRNIGHGGVDHAQALRMTALLHQLVADVESAIAYPRRGRRHLISSINLPADQVLDQMAAEPDLQGRMALLHDLYDAVYEWAGSAAAGTIRLLPYPKETNR